uniref:AB hydrolase-1 domain-containing protein n=1 Tax=Noccaea caerulescens TaxID=107243 RepID=A0A1J3I9M3_NOCCA
MAPSFLSVASFVEAILRRRFSSAGLSQQTLSIDSETTIQFWGPSPSSSSANKQKPSLLLLHGFGPSAVWQWNRQIKPLSLSFHLYIPDLVFFGGSTTSSASSEKNRSEIFQASSMGKLMEKLSVERFSVVGTSYGGFVAYNMAKMLPEKVEKVVLASSGVNMRRSDNEAFIARAKCVDIAEVMLPSSGTDLRRFSGMISSWRLDYVPDFLLNDFCQKMYSEKREEKTELLEGLSIGKDDKTNVSPIQQDVMLVWGEQDQVFPLTMAHDLKEMLGKKATLKVIQKTSHIPQTEKPKEFNDIIMSFLLAPSPSL